MSASTGTPPIDLPRPAATQGPGSSWLSVLTAALIGALSALVLFIAPVPAVVLGAVLGVIIAGLRRPAWGVAALVFLIPLVSSLGRGRVVPVLAPNEILLIVAVALLIIRWFTRPFALPDQRGVGRGFLVFTALGAFLPLAALVLRGGSPNGADVRELLIYVQYYLLFIVVIGGVRAGREVAVVVRAILGSSMIVSIIGLLQVMGVPYVREAVQELFIPRDYHAVVAYELRYRAVSTLGAWNGLGVYLTLVCYLAAALLYAPRRIIDRRFLSLVLMVNIAGVLATGSHTGLVTLGLGLAVIAGVRGRLRHLWLWLLLSIPWIVILWGPISHRIGRQFFSGDSPMPYHLFSRYLVWQLIWEELSRPLNFIFGLRPSIPPDALWETEDNYFLHVLARGGVIFLIAFTFLAGIFFRIAERARRAADPMTAALGLTLTVGLGQLLLACITGTFFRFSGYADLVWILVALAVISSHAPETPRTSAPDGEDAGEVSDPRPRSDR